MDTVVKVMDLDVNIMDRAAFRQKVESYLESDQLNILLFAASRLFVEAGEREEFGKLLAEVDVIVPEEETLASMAGQAAVYKNAVTADYPCLADLMAYLCKKHYTLYMVARSEKSLDTVKEFFAYSEYNISFVGGRMEQDYEDALIINEINGLAPDIVLVDLDTPLQENWIMEHKTKVNTKLCVGLGGLMQKLLSDYEKVPAILCKLHLDRLYKSLLLNSKWVKQHERRRFEKKLEEYKDKKQDL